MAETTGGGDPAPKQDEQTEARFLNDSFRSGGAEGDDSKAQKRANEALAEVNKGMENLGAIHRHSLQVGFEDRRELAIQAGNEGLKSPVIAPRQPKKRSFLSKLFFGD
jgi:hypothetical protein